MIARRVDGIALMSADEARATESAIIHTGDQLRRLLLTFSEQEGYRALGYSSYTAWAEAIAPRLFGVSRRRLAQELTAALIERELGTMVPNSTPIPERQLRPLGVFVTQAAINGAAIIETWAAAQSIAADRGERFNALHVTESVAEYFEATEEATIARPSKWNRGMQTSHSAEWYTPDQILDPVRALFGVIDLDPCSHADAQQQVRAAHYYTQADDGLTQPWHGNVYVNPPYGDAIKPWIPRLIAAYTAGECRSVVALVPGRTDTDWFAPLFDYPICFVHGRLKFSGAEHSATFPSIVVYLGPDLAAFRRAFHTIGPIMLPDD